jgi:CRP-like cAMP-binding protein
MTAVAMSESSIDLLRAQRFLSGLTDWQLQRLATHAKRSMFHAGNRVFREGEPADRMWLIRTGRVAIDTGVAGHGDTVIDELGAGAVLGWSWLLPPYRWQFGAVAVETTHTVEVNAPALRELCHADPILGFQVALGLVGVVSERLRATRHRLTTDIRGHG